MKIEQTCCRLIFRAHVFTILTQINYIYEKVYVAPPKKKRLSAFMKYVKKSYFPNTQRCKEELEKNPEKYARSNGPEVDGGFEKIFEAYGNDQVEGR